MSIEDSINERRDDERFPIVSSIYEAGNEQQEEEEEDEYDVDLYPTGEMDMSGMTEYPVESELVGRRSGRSSKGRRVIKMTCLSCGIVIEFFFIWEYLSWSVAGIVFGSIQYEQHPKCDVNLVKIMTLLVGISFFFVLIFEVLLLFSESFKLCFTCCALSEVRRRDDDDDEDEDEDMITTRKRRTPRTIKTLNLLNLIFLSGYIAFVIFSLIFSVTGYVTLWIGECKSIWAMYFYDIYLIATVIDVLCILIVTPCLCLCCVCSDDL